MSTPTARIARWSPAATADAPTLLLIHGAGGRAADWPDALCALPEAHVAALDLPGHGSAPGPVCASAEASAAAVLALITAEGWPRVVLAGHSMGGAVALSAALRADAALRGLILIGTGAHLPVNPALLAAAQSDPERARQLIARYALSADSSPAARAAQDGMETAVLAADLAACAAFDVRERLAEIRLPTLILAGSRDRMTPPEQSRFLAERLPYVQLAILEAGHFIAQEQPAAVAAAVAAFVRTVG